MRDHYHVRFASLVCPLCNGPKEKGLIACWPCFKKHDLRNGNPAAEQIIAIANRELETKHDAIAEKRMRLAD